MLDTATVRDSEVAGHLRRTLHGLVLTAIGEWSWVCVNELRLHLALCAFIEGMYMLQCAYDERFVHTFSTHR